MNMNMNMNLIRLLWAFFSFLNCTPALAQLISPPLTPVSLTEIGFNMLDESSNHLLGIPQEPLSLQRIRNACQCDLVLDGTIDDLDLEDLRKLSNTSNREERDSCAQLDNRFNSYNFVDKSDANELDDLLKYFNNRTINCSIISKVISLADDSGLRNGCDFKLGTTGAIEKVSNIRLGYHSIEDLNTSRIVSNPIFFDENDSEKLLEIKKAYFKRAEINWWYPYHFTRSIPPYELLTYAGQIGPYLGSENLQQLTPWFPIFRDNEMVRLKLADYGERIEQPAYCKADQMLEFTPYCQLKNNLLGDREKLNLATDETKIYFRGSSSFVLMRNTLLTAADPQYNSRPFCVLDRQTKNAENH